MITKDFCLKMKCKYYKHNNIWTYICTFRDDINYVTNDANLQYLLWRIPDCQHKKKVELISKLEKCK